MNKIVDFSSVFEGVYIDDSINKVKEELSQDNLSSQTLCRVKGKLESLSSRICQKLQNQVSFTQSVCEKLISQQEEVCSLLHLCGTKSLNKQVKTITDTALKLGKEEGETLSSKIDELKQGITDLNHKHALSLENRQMIHMAKKHLNGLSDTHETQTSVAGKELEKQAVDQFLEDPIDLSMALYEIAGNLYKADIGAAFCGFNQLPELTKSKLEKALIKSGYDIQKLKQPFHLESFNKQKYFTIQTLIGYSNFLLYGDFEIMDEDEIDDLFYDLDLTLSLESVADL